MVSALGQADSFNSSGATVVPDRNEDGTVRYHTRGRAAGVPQRTVNNGPLGTNGHQSLRGMPSLVTQARMLMPEDSFGRELEAMVNAQGDDGNSSQQHWSFDRESTAPPGDSNGSSQPVPELSFSQILNVPSSPSEQPIEPPSAADADFASQIEAYLQSNNYTTQSSSNTNNALTSFEAFRPASAQSHTTSEYSFESTDVDTDSVMSDSNPVLQPNNERASDLGFGGMNLDAGNSNATHHFWLDSSRNNRGGAPLQGIKRELEWERSRTVAPDSVSPPDLANSGGQRGAGDSEDESARKTRLEHRRQINRKSAQKHRKRRKEELEVLTQRVAERDHRISQLERDLAVEKAKTAQILSFIKSNGVKLGADGGS